MLSFASQRTHTQKVGVFNSFLHLKSRESSFFEILWRVCQEVPVSGEMEAIP